MAEDIPDDDRSEDTGADTGGDMGADPTAPSVEDELAAAVDDAMKLELKRQRARFVQEIMGLDRLEGVGRAEERWNDEFYRSIGADPPDETPDEQTG